MTKLEGDTFVFWPKGRCQVWRRLVRQSKGGWGRCVGGWGPCSWVKPMETLQLPIGLLLRVYHLECVAESTRYKYCVFFGSNVWKKNLLFRSISFVCMIFKAMHAVVCCVDQRLSALL